MHEQQELDGDGPGGRLSTARLHWGRVASLVWILFALQTLALVINVQCLNENLVSGLITLICFNRRTYCFWEKFFGQKLAAPILLIFFLQQATNVLNLSRYEHLNSSSHSSTTKQILYQDPGNRCHREPPIIHLHCKAAHPKAPAWSTFRSQHRSWCNSPLYGSCVHREAWILPPQVITTRTKACVSRHFESTAH